MEKKNGYMIYDWMVQDEGLSGNELVCYAFLYKVTNCGTEVYSGGYADIARAIGVTFPTAYNVLRKLSDHGLIRYDDMKSISVAM